MHRRCTHCDRPFTPRDLAREESKGMEAERRELGLVGVLFRYYSCPACGQNDIFVNVTRVPDESYEEFVRRRRELEQVVSQLHADRVDVVLV